MRYFVQYKVWQGIGDKQSGWMASKRCWATEAGARAHEAMLKEKPSVVTTRISTYEDNEGVLANG